MKLDDVQVDKALAIIEERNALRGALAALVRRLDEIHADPDYISVWAIAQVHRGAYAGPKYDVELEAARAALAKEGK